MQEERLRLKPGKLKWSAIFVASLAFLAGGSAMISAGLLSGWLVVAFFGLGVLVALFQLFGNRSYLLLTPEAYTIGSPIRSATVRWSDVDSFSVSRLGYNRMVMVNYAPEHEARSTLRHFNRVLVGHDAALPDTYGMGAERLAALMNEWKARHAPASGPNGALPE